MMYEAATQPLGLGKIFIESLKLTKFGFKKVFLFVLIAVIVSAGLSSKIIDDHNFFFNSLSLYQFHWMHIFRNFIIALVVCWCYVGIFVQYHSVLQQQKTGVKQTAIHAIKHFFPLFITMFLYFSMLSFGLVVFILPGIFIGVACTLAIAIVATETKNPIKALKRSYQLVVPNWWRALVLPVAPFILLLLIGYLSNTFAKFLFIHGMNNLTMILSIRMIFSAVLGFFFTTWFFSLKVIVLHDFKLRAALKVQQADETITKSDDETVLNFLEQNT